MSDLKTMTESENKRMENIILNFDQNLISDKPISLHHFLKQILKKKIETAKLKIEDSLRVT